MTTEEGREILLSAMRYIRDRQPEGERHAGLLYWTDSADADAVLIMALLREWFLST
jgi:hypothetical protein